MHWLFLFYLLPAIFLAFSVGPENKYPQSFFRAPIDNELRLSGTFGELRSNHFHSGIDVKGYRGLPLYAAAEGYVKRVKVEKDGYGNALYLAHPNGYTTVYAHLNSFAPELEEYIKRVQYQKESFEVDLYPPRGRFSFEQGEKIGEMGNSGSSSGPHLHFEIRDSETEKPINPLLFGLEVADSRAPRMHQLKVYYLNDKLETLKTKTHSLVRRGNRYSLSEEVLDIGAWRAGFGIKVFDHMDGASNWNGVYEVEMRVSDQPAYQFDMETFSFSETRYLNAHMDYAERVRYRSYFNRLYTLPGNRLSIYGERPNRGAVKLYRDRAVPVTIIARDVAGNESRLEFKVRRSAIETANQKRVYDFFLPYDEANVISQPGLQARFPRGALYQNLYLKYNAAQDNSSGIYSDVYSLHHDDAPLHRYIQLRIQPTLLPDNLRDKAFIAYCTEKNKVVNFGGEWRNNMLTTRVRSLGDFCVMVDRQPPSITPIAFSQNMKGYNRMSFRIEDNLPTGGSARGIRYRATVDGEWILMEYDEKNDLITHYFDDRIGPGSHELRIELTDDRDNRRVYARTFVR